LVETTAAEIEQYLREVNDQPRLTKYEGRDLSQQRHGDVSGFQGAFRDERRMKNLRGIILHHLLTFLSIFPYKRRIYTLLFFARSNW